MSLQHDFDAYLADLGFAALEQGVATVASVGSPLVPFLLIDHRGARRTRVLTANGVDNDLESGRAEMRRLSLDVQACALAFDGFVNVEGQRIDTVFVEVHHRHTKEGALIGQRYRFEPATRNFTAIGKPFLYDGVPSVF